MLQVNVRILRGWRVLLMLILVVALAACGVATANDTTGNVTRAEAPAATQVPAAETPAEQAASDEPGGDTTFVIDAAQSEVRFTLSEVLMGKPTTVVGRGRGIEGSVTVNFDDHSRSTISPIVIDATQLATDNNMRNGQIRRAILQSNNPDYQFITFTPTQIEGLPDQATPGVPFDIQVTGDLTIRDTTKPMTFAVTVTPVSEREIHGSATTTLLRADFDLQIPRVPSVADVSEDVLLEFDFVALAP